MGRRLSEWERLDRAREVAERELGRITDEVDKLETKIELIDAGDLDASNRVIFGRRLDNAKVRLLTARRRFEEAQAAQVEHESTLARFRPPDPEPVEGEVLEGEELVSTIEQIKRDAGMSE